MITLGLTILVGVLYRLGGWQYGNKLYRRLGIPLLTTVWLSLHGVPVAWPLILSGLLMALALTTYWDWLFGYDNYYAHALGVGLSLAPIAYATGHLLYLIPVVAVLTLWSGLWSKFWWQDWIEEGGRLLPLMVLLHFIT